MAAADDNDYWLLEEFWIDRHDPEQTDFDTFDAGQSAFLRSDATESVSLYRVVNGTRETSSLEWVSQHVKNQP